MKFLIVGLGNIGEEYQGTRHNIGFDIVDSLAKEMDSNFDLDRHAFISDFKFKGRSFHLIKPTTFMNLSGKAVKYWLDKLKIPKDNLLVILDDVALPFGQIRIKHKGSDGGHNGLKDINQKLGTNQYPRLRFGIGNDYHSGDQVRYVLGNWTDAENALLDKPIQRSCEAVKSFGTIGITRTMNEFNQKIEQ